VGRPRLSKPARARRYLQASMEAGYTGLPAEHKHAKESLMRSHERAYSDVRRHALAGTNQDFDQPLTAGEREHQRYLRTQEGLTEKDVRDIRQDLRGQDSKPASSSSTTSSRTAQTASAGALSAIDAATTGKGSLFLQIAGVFVTLALIYLLVAGKGTNALRGITNLIVSAATTFISPIDPIAKLETSLGATPVSTNTSNETASPGATGASAGASGSGAGGSSIGGSGVKTWRDHLAPRPSRVRVRTSTPAQVRAFERATGAHFAHGAG
jgi:hypothetical protein